MVLASSEKAGKALGSRWLRACVIDISGVIGNIEPESCEIRIGILLMRKDFNENIVDGGSLRYIALARISKEAVTRSAPMFWGSICRMSDDGEASAGYTLPYISNADSLY